MNQLFGQSKSKCLHEIYDAEKVDELVSQKADTAHSSTEKKYGVGTTQEYGHVKLTTSTGMPTGDMSGVALAGTMGYTLFRLMQIPVNGIFWAVEGAFTESTLATKLGYGTWEKIIIAGIPDGMEAFFRTK